MYHRQRKRQKRHAIIQPPRQTEPHSDKFTHSHTHTHSHAQTLSLSQSLTQTLKHSHTHTHSQTHTHRDTETHTLKDENEYFTILRMTMHKEDCEYHEGHARHFPNHVDPAQQPSHVTPQPWCSRSFPHNQSIISIICSVFIIFI